MHIMHKHNLKKTNSPTFQENRVNVWMMYAVELVKAGWIEALFLYSVPEQEVYFKGILQSHLSLRRTRKTISLVNCSKCTCLELCLRYRLSKHKSPTHLLQGVSKFTALTLKRLLPLSYRSHLPPCRWTLRPLLSHPALWQSWRETVLSCRSSCRSTSPLQPAHRKYEENRLTWKCDFSFCIFKK